MFILFGCASRPDTSPGLVYLSSDISYQLTQVPDELIGQEQTVFITIESENSYTELLVVTTFTKTAIGMVFLTPEGIPLTEFTYQLNGDVHSKQYLPSVKLQPKYILANLQIMLWPVAELNKALFGARVLEKNSSRQVLSDDELIYEVQFGENEDVFYNHINEFKMVITQVSN